MTRGLLFDFGQTSVKRGCAHYGADKLLQVELWPDAPTVCAELFPSDQSEQAIRQRWQRMVDIIAASWAVLPSDQRPATAVGISMACYLFDGHPWPRDQGCYGALQRLSPHLATFVEDELGRSLRQAVKVTLMHDGAAAAAAYAGQERAVVLTLGTAIGNGFPPSAGALRPFASDFALSRAGI
jgi:hypothetical protein